MAALSGFLLALAWPAIGGFAPLAFVALIPLFFIEEHFFQQQERLRPRAMMKFLYLSFVLWNAITTWWIACVSESVATKAFSVGTAVLCNAMFMVLPWMLFHWTKRKVGQREGYFGLVFFWLSFEYLHMQWDLSWPWLTLGNVFADHVALVQWYEYSGVFGGSLWVLLANIIGFFTLRRWIQTKRVPRVKLAFWALLLSAPMALSLLRFHSYEESVEPVHVVVVQPNIDPYNEKFDGLTPEEQLDRMLALAEEQVDEQTEYLVFPETALQEMANAYTGPNGQLALKGLWENDLDDSRSVVRLRRYLEQHPQLRIIVGMSSAYLFGEKETLTASARQLKPTNRYYENYNAAMQLSVEDPIQVHHKSKLVVGVELMPFASVLGDLAIDLGGTSGSLGRQETRINFESTEHSVTPAICYESIYGEYIGEYVQNGADLLFIITNDGWWADTPGYKQHLAYARLRAVEHRRSIARSANTGISAFIDQRGNIYQATEWWVPAAIKGSINANAEQTFYTRHGDQIARAALFFAAMLLIFTLVQHLRKRTPAG